MYHSIAFFDPSAMTTGNDYTFASAEKNTWDDFYLIPNSRPLVNPPGIHTNFIDIPGANGVLDLTDLISGAPTYSARSGSWDFIVDNYHEPWDVIFSKLLNYLHGKRKNIILEDDKAYFYEGRFSINAWKSDSQYSTVTIDYVIDPFKKSVQKPSESWLWDTFDFVTGIITDPTPGLPRQESL